MHICSYQNSDWYVIGFQSEIAGDTQALIKGCIADSAVITFVYWLLFLSDLYSFRLQHNTLHTAQSAIGSALAQNTVCQNGAKQNRHNCQQKQNLLAIEWH